MLGCGFDGSPTAHEALEWTVALAARTDARVQVIAAHPQHAFDHVAATGVPGTRSGRAEVHARLRDRVEQVAASLADEIQVEPALLEGDPAQTLSEQSEHLDLLVLGSRGYGPLRSVLLGSVSAQVIRASSCATVVVPRGGRDDHVQRDPRVRLLTRSSPWLPFGLHPRYSMRRGKWSFRPMAAARLASDHTSAD